jgi:Flp pilus assembly protein TadD
MPGKSIDVGSRTAATGLGLLLAIAAVGLFAPLANGRDRDRDTPLELRAEGALNTALLAGYKAASQGKWAVAQQAFGTALREDLRNPRLQFLNGLAYSEIGRRGDRSDLDLAKVGFQNAAEFAPGDYWSNLYLGYQQLDDGDFTSAQATLARAVRDQPERWEGLYGLGVASYYAGDSLTAQLAAEKASKLKPEDPEVQRLVAFAAASTADPAASDLATRYARINPKDHLTVRRVGEMIREVHLAQSDAAAADSSTSASTPDTPANQILVDVTIILSSILDTKSRGVNLFDGLGVQYGYGNSFNASRSSSGNWSSNRSITHSIGVPQLNYSLNLFNDSGQYYQVLARPSLTAYLGRESEFFAGRTINVKVSGINLGTLQPIDVGVGLKVAPESIAGNKVTFRVNASRSFLSREQVGTFDESLTTFKQLVGATAEVEFGQTLVLSALSENVEDAHFSKVPGLGEIPGASTFFKNSSRAHRQETLLILITPVPPTSFRTNMASTPATVEKLISTWKTIIDPQSNLDAILKRLNRSRFFSGAERGDLRWNHVLTPSLASEALRENVELAGM